MSKLKALAGQTLIYGVSTIFGRLLSYSLTPIYTYIFADTAPVGIISSLYGFIALINVLCALGMETTFFYYANKRGEKVAFTNALSIVLVAAGSLALLTFMAASGIDAFRQTGNPWYYRLIAGMVFFDAMTILPFARLRIENKARKFAILKLLSVVITVVVTLLLLFAYQHFRPLSALGQLMHGEDMVFYVFFGNFLASLITLLLVLPYFKGYRFSLEPQAVKEMLNYSWPLIAVGVAAWINENLDKTIMADLIDGSRDEGFAQTGIYGSVYKLSIAMALVVQAFKFAAEPFFFSIQKDHDARDTYALVLKWFVIAECLVFLVVALNLDLFIHIVQEDFRSGKAVVPVVLIGQMFLGVYYNLSIWYKLTEKTIWGLYMSLAGSVVTIVMLFGLVPVIGYMGAAWATLASFFTMMMMSFVVGRKFYYVAYNYRRITVYICLAIVFWLIYQGAGIEGVAQQVVIANTLVLFFVAFVWAIEKPRKLLLLRK